MFDGSQDAKVYTYEDTPLRNGPLWHSFAPLAAWTFRPSSSLSFYNADTNVLTNKYAYRIGSRPLPTKFGWYVGQENEIVAFDPEGNYLGRAVFDPYLVDGKPELMYWVLADGSISKSGKLDQVTFVFVKDNRVYCQPLQDYEADPANPRIPRFDKLPIVTTTNPDHEVGADAARHESESCASNRASRPFSTVC